MTPTELDRVADKIARARGAGPLHLMPSSAAGQYRAMARVALTEAATCLEERMETFPQSGRHTRAGWAVGILRIWAERDDV